MPHPVQITRMSTSQRKLRERARPAVAVLMGAAALLVADQCLAQTVGQAPPPGEMRPVSDFGENLSEADAMALLREMVQMTESALEASRAAEQAAAVADVKAAANRVAEAVWGLPTGRAPGAGTGEVELHGWKERWQVTGAEFHPAFIERYGTQPPRVTDPRQLGIMGRGLAVRGRLERVSSNSSHAILAQPTAAAATLASLNNVIGWMYITTGLKGREVQPRISLTHIWDAPSGFWNTSADTGWLREVQAQALNIIKTDYAGDVAEARGHAAGMTQLLEKVLRGVDADRNGAVEPKPAEGGLNAALTAASRATLAN
jgi:hypothetical protein